MKPANFYQARAVNRQKDFITEKFSYPFGGPKSGNSGLVFRSAARTLGASG
jgi:hypothetical protein